MKSLISFYNISLVIPLMVVVLGVILFFSDKKSMAESKISGFGQVSRVLRSDL